MYASSRFQFPDVVTDSFSTVEAKDKVSVDFLFIKAGAEIEALSKEQAVLEMYRIYDLEPVIYGQCLALFDSHHHPDLSARTDNLRPASTEQALATKGRKNRSPKKGGKGKKAAEDEDAEEPESASTADEDQGDTDMLSTVGSPGDTASMEMDGSDTEEVIKPRPSRSRGSTKKPPAIRATPEEEPPSPMTRRKPGPKSKKNKAEPKKAVDNIESSPNNNGVHVQDFVGTEPPIDGKSVVDGAPAAKGEPEAMSSQPPVWVAKPEGV